jgi:outer membrane protein OmpA-like peptidoglycan-associated protein
MPFRRRHLAALMTSAVLLAACAGEPPKRAFIVFFEPFAAETGPDANKVLETAAAVALRFPNEPVQVVGYADPEGTSADNRALSRKRADAVTADLVRRGVAQARIRESARGATEPTLAMVESRRVEIRIGQ